ncbi:MAG: hypothetical protein ACI4TM_00280 [Candidatus Cryptobacteroides sp.]
MKTGNQLKPVYLKPVIQEILISAENGICQSSSFITGDIPDMEEDTLIW